jgi:glutathione S-transferase
MLKAIAFDLWETLLTDTPEISRRQERLRLDRMERVLQRREWLADRFSVADIAMADVLRLVDRFDGLTRHHACRAYVERAKARPAFAKAYADQLAHFAAAD